MALSNAKYDAIMRRYNENRIQNERERRERIREVCEALPAYKALSDEISTMTLSYGLKALDGEEGATEELDRFAEQLPERECDLFVRRYFFAEEIPAIARRYQMTENNVTVSLSRIRKKLRKYLKEGEFIE